MCEVRNIEEIISQASASALLDSSDNEEIEPSNLENRESWQR